MEIRKLKERDIPEILALMQGNPPLPSEDSIRDEMQVLPIGLTLQNKYYVGFYEQGYLTAGLDLLILFTKENGLH